MVFTAQAAPPVSYALLNITRCAAGVALPAASVQAGRLTRVSRGMETTWAREWSWLTCTTIAVSERAVSPVSPPARVPLLPARESEPRTRRLNEPSVAAGGLEVPRLALMSTLLMFPLNFQYAYPAAAPPSTTRATRVHVAIRRARLRVLRPFR